MLKIIKTISTIVLIAIVHFYFYSSEYVKKIDYETYDFMMMFSNKIQHNITDSFYTVIVDIDEKSLQALGQWPWARVINANLIDEINALNPSALGINILFPEVDRVSPVHIQEFYKKFFDLEVQFKQIPTQLKDNDKLFLESLLRSHATLSTYFYNNVLTSEHCKETVYKKDIFSSRETKFHVNSFLCNHKELQEGVENFGFINAWRDSDSVFRRIPLFMEYQEKVFPSFALATLLSIDNNIQVETKEDTILLNFPLHKPKVFSAIDILSAKVPKDEIQGKIVILGSSLIGLTPTYKISTGEEISNSMIHAFAIDNILNNSFLRQPPEYKVINLIISFLLILYFMYLFTKKNYLKIITLLLLTLLLSFIWTFYWYLQGVYVSIAYLCFPFLFLFILLIIYHVSVINKEQREQEKLFIKQSKLASMGEMISLIAHQWRQPLSVINGTVLNMDMDYRKNKLHNGKFDDYLNEIEGTTAYLSKTINDFTDFFSKNKEAERFNLSTVINQAIQLSSSASSKNIELIYSEEEIFIQGYHSELLQSLLVLLNNAIYVCEKNLESIGKGEILIEALKVNNKVRISVEDNGGGINKKDIKKIFNPYFTTKERNSGTGLGLYILKLIIEDSMNGKVTLHNGNKGAIFTIEIPLHIG